MHATSVGIALAAYRPEPLTFAEQLRSIQKQTFRDWICVMTFDSPLAELASAPGLAPFREDPRFRWVENPQRLGHKKNFERAIQLALAEGVDAIGCSDQDDVWYPAKIARSVEALRKAGPLSLVHTDMHVLGPDGRIGAQTAWELERRGVQHVSPRDLLVRNVVAGCAMLMDAELVRRFPVIPEGAAYHDHWYALVASVHGGVHAIHEPLYAYRQHAENVLGVTPFPGIFATGEHNGIGKIARKCLSGWRFSQALEQAARQAGLPLPDENSHAARFLALGISRLKDDPALARACFARSFGKILGNLEDLLHGRS